MLSARRRAHCASPPRPGPTLPTPFLPTHLPSHSRQPLGNPRKKERKGESTPPAAATAEKLRGEKQISAPDSGRSGEPVTVAQRMPPVSPLLRGPPPIPDRLELRDPPLPARAGHRCFRAPPGPRPAQRGRGQRSGEVTCREWDLGSGGLKKESGSFRSLMGTVWGTLAVLGFMTALKSASRSVSESPRTCTIWCPAGGGRRRRLGPWGCRLPRSGRRALPLWGLRGRLPLALGGWLRRRLLPGIHGFCLPRRAPGPGGRGLRPRSPARRAQTREAMRAAGRAALDRGSNALFSLRAGGLRGGPASPAPAPPPPPCAPAPLVWRLRLGRGCEEPGPGAPENFFPSLPRRTPDS